MKGDKNIFIAFALNLLFSIFEFAGGLLTGSVAIASDALHDMGDAVSIGIACILERKSKQKPDDEYTFGYSRFGVLGGLITTTLLIVGSLVVMWNGVYRVFHPTVIHYEGMMIFAVVGAAVNFGAAYLTREGESVNQRAVNLHMLEDVLGWIVVLIGAIVMRFTNFAILDPLMSLGVALYILIHGVRNLKEALVIFLDKVPAGLCVKEIQTALREVDGVVQVHHIHLWSLDGQQNCATIHVVTDSDEQIKQQLRQILKERGISHVTLELERPGEHPDHCDLGISNHEHHHHHHHHHHH